MYLQDLAQTLYLTRYVELSGSTPGQLRDFNLNIKNEDSHMLRGSGLVGLLYTTPRTQARVALGLGLQAEFYLMTWFMTGSAGPEAAFKVDLQLPPANKATCGRATSCSRASWRCACTAIGRPSR